jgi:hypothetical protein
LSPRLLKKKKLYLRGWEINCSQPHQTHGLFPAGSGSAFPFLRKISDKSNLHLTAYPRGKRPSPSRPFFLTTNARSSPFHPFFPAPYVLSSPHQTAPLDPHDDMDGESLLECMEARRFHRRRRGRRDTDGVEQESKQLEHGDDHI